MSLVIPVEELFSSHNRSGVTSKHDSWEEVPLRQIVELQNGFPFNSKDFNIDGKGFPLIRIRNVTSGKIETYYSGSFLNDYVVKTGDLLIGMDGDFNSSLLDR